MNPDDASIESCFGRCVSEEFLDPQHQCPDILPSPIANARIIDEYFDMDSPNQGYTA